MGMPEVQMVQKVLDKYKTVLQRVIKPIICIQPTALKSLNYRLLEVKRVFSILDLIIPKHILLVTIRQQKRLGKRLAGAGVAIPVLFQP